MKWCSSRFPQKYESKVQKPTKINMVVFHNFLEREGSWKRPEVNVTKLPF